MNIKKENTLWTIPFICLVAVNSLNAVASYMVNPIFPQYLTSHGVEFALTGVVSSVLSWVAMLIRPFSGAAGDRYNKKKILIGTYLGMGVCMLLYSKATGFSGIFMIRILHGILFGISGTISMAFASQYVPISRMAEGVGYIGLASLVGNLIGPQLGSEISDALGIGVLFVVCSIICIVCGICISLIPYHHVTVTKKIEKISIDTFFDSSLLMFVFLIFLFSFGNGIISYYLKSMGIERNIENISLFFTVYSVFMLFLKPLAGKLQDKMGLNFILYPAYLAYAVGIVILANAYSLLPVLIAAIFKAIGQGCGIPAIQAEAIRKSGKERSGIASSTVMIGQDLGNGIGPIYAGALIKPIGYTKMFYIYAASLIVGVIILYLYSVKEKKEGK